MKRIKSPNLEIAKAIRMSTFKCQSLMLSSVLKDHSLGSKNLTALSFRVNEISVDECTSLDRADQ